MKNARIIPLLVALLGVPNCFGDVILGSRDVMLNADILGATVGVSDIVDEINDASCTVPLPKEVAKAKELEPEEEVKDFYMEFTGKFKPEMFYGKNISLFNNAHNFDQVWYMRHTLDFNLHTQYGQKTYGCNVVETKFAVRDKAVWGNPRTIAATTDATIRILADVGSEHRHFLTKHIFWMREGWIKFNLTKAFACCSYRNYDLTLGAFSFELGRGIALGDAYAVGPELLGFYSDSIVDQYAFGMKLSAEVVPDVLSFDAYGAILENFSGSLGDTGAKIFGQEIGRANLERGFGAVNFIAAGRFNITAIRNDWVDWTIEPYLLYNSDPEVDVDFRADANSKLATIGIASEYYSDTFEFGFDAAANIGRQLVKAWDRNHIETQELNGRLVQVNSHVYVGVDPNVTTSNLNLYKAIVSSSPVLAQTPTLPGGFPVAPTPLSNTQITSLGKQAQTLIRGTTPKDSSANGQQIGTISGWQNAIGGFPPATPSTLQDAFFNAPDSVDFGRFRNCYTNQYKGYMFVADGCYWIWKNELQVAFGGGISSGDEDPNHDEIDGDYKGFIPLQEVYNGKRVQSAFVMGGAGKIKRPLSVPDPIQNSDEFAEVLDGFTNLAYLGGALKWEPKNWCKKFKLFPNILFYWQPHPTKKYDITLGRSINESARSFLGTEINTYLDYWIFPNARTYFVGAIFVPGSHYKDVSGFPISQAQADLLNRLNDSGNIPATLPGLGSDIAWTFNIGIEYKF